MPSHDDLREQVIRSLYPGLPPDWVPGDPFPVSPQRWPDPLTGPWYADLRFTFTEDLELRCVGVEVFWGHTGMPDELTAAMMRQLPLGRFRAQAQQWIAEQAAQLISEADPAVPDRVPPELVREVQEALDARGHADRSAAFYAGVAETYVGALRRHRNPVQAVREAALADGVHLSRPGASKAVRRARELGLLGPARKRGRPGGDILRGEHTDG